MKIAAKVLAVATAVALGAFALAGCSSSNSKEDDKTGESAGMTDGKDSMGKDSAGEADKTANSEKQKFPQFKAEDLATGETVDESIFSENAVTVVNFWFSGCSPCVNEMPHIQKESEQLKKANIGFLGISADAAYGDDVMKETKDIMSKQGVTYRNIAMPTDGEGREYVDKIRAFPTTVLVDREGNIIGKPIEGAIADEGGLSTTLLERINEILDKDSKSK